MKIINSHYIPLPEPRWLIVDPKGAIYEQLGTLTVVEEAPKEKGKYGIVTHSHPVVAFADIGYTEDDGDRINIMTSLTIADGQVLDDVVLENCTRLCPAGHRKLISYNFNTLVFKLMTGPDADYFDLDEFIEDLKLNGVTLIFPKNELQEIELTLFDANDIGMIISDMTGIQFVVPFYAILDKKGVHIQYDKIFLEFVNQARAYLKINPKFRFHFKASLKELNPLVEKLNNELNDYLEQKEKN